MRLLECHVENFGKLSDYTVELKKGVNVFCRENGWGKSTFAIFLKVMFYGFENEKKRAGNQREREQYRPWQGGVYGGSVVFCAGQRKYRVERTFGVREKEDRFTLYDADTGLLSYDYSQDLGRELFQLDAVSFQKTVCRMELNRGPVSTDAIHAKLGNLAEDINDLENFSLAKKNIIQEMNRLTPHRKTGLLYKIKENILDIENVLMMHEYRKTKLQELEDQLAQIKTEIEENSLELQGVRDRFQCEGKYQVQKLQEQQYRDILQRYEKKEMEVEELEEYFGNGIPEPEELKDIIDIEEQVRQEEKAVKNFGLTQEEKDLLNEIKGKWSSYPDEDELENCRELWEQIKEQEDSEKEEAAREQDYREQKKPYIMYTGILLLCLGVVFLIKYPVIGIFFLLGGGISIYWKMYIEKTDLEDTVTEESVEDIETEQLRTQMDAYLGQYPLEQVRSPGEHIHTLQVIMVQIKSILQREEKQSKLNENMEELNKKIFRFYNKYGFEVEEHKDIQLHNMLLFLEKYQRLTEELSQLGLAKEQFEQEHKGKGSLNFSGEEMSFQQWNEQLLQLDTQKENLTKMMYEKIGEIDEVKEQLLQDECGILKKEQLMCRKKEMEHRFEILEKTLYYLSNAKERLALRYQRPIEQGIEKYRNYFDESCGQFKMDTNLELLQVEKGAFRSMDMLSKGWQELTEICVRFALADAMFTREKPFLILDDPYVNLDEKKLQGGLRMLEQAGNDYQILYFTCHSGRTL